MAAFVLTSKTILIGTTWSAPSTAPGPIVPLPTIAGTISSSSDLTPFCTAADTGMSTAMQETTHFASGGYEEVIPGITSGDDIVLEANSDYAASQIYAIVNTTLGGLSRAGSAVRYVDIKPTSSARSATNPSFVAAVYLMSWKPGNGSVGNVAKMQLTLKVTGAFTHLAS